MMSRAKLQSWSVKMTTTAEGAHHRRHTHRRCDMCLRQLSNLVEWQWTHVKLAMAGKALQPVCALCNSTGTSVPTLRQVARCLNRMCFSKCSVDTVDQVGPTLVSLLHHQDALVIFEACTALADLLMLASKDSTNKKIKSLLDCRAEKGFVNL
jgi:hypothetical protein